MNGRLDDGQARISGWFTFPISSLSATSFAGSASRRLLLSAATTLTRLKLAVELYRRIVLPTTPIRTLRCYDAELLKLAYNAFLCMKISFANFLSQIGDRCGGVDLDDITDALSLDPKIGSGCLRSGAPYGGVCYPRDVDAFQRLARSEGLDAPLVAEINRHGNDQQRAI